MCRISTLSNCTQNFKPSSSDACPQPLYSAVRSFDAAGRRRGCVDRVFLLLWTQISLLLIYQWRNFLFVTPKCSILIDGVDILEKLLLFTMVFMEVTFFGVEVVVFYFDIQNM